MTDVILRTNATPVYAFLSLINACKAEEGTLGGKKILDCGAGGVLPPLALFHQQGFDCYGIDISDEQLQRAREFCDQQGLQLNLRKADMRQLPFEGETFDYVYEHYSMCHLSKQDTARAIGEMKRVLRKGGLCFVGVISMDTWPRSSFGEQKEPGEFWREETVHSMFTDEEGDRLVSDWEIILKEKRAIYNREIAQETSLDAWMKLHPEARGQHTREAWKAKYAQRVEVFQYVHVYYCLQKPV